MWRAPLPWLLLGRSLTLHLYRRLLLLLCACLHLHLGQGRLLKGCLRVLLAQLRCQLVQLQLLPRASTLQGGADLVRKLVDSKNPQQDLASISESVTESFCGCAPAGTKAYQHSKGVVHLCAC